MAERHPLHRCPPRPRAVPGTLPALGSQAGGRGAHSRRQPPGSGEAPAAPSPPAADLLLGRLVLEAGVLDVVGPDGLALLVLGAQVLHGLGDGQPAALDVFAADPGGAGGPEGCRGSGSPSLPQSQKGPAPPLQWTAPPGQRTAHPVVSACRDEALVTGHAQVGKSPLYREEALPYS